MNQHPTCAVLVHMGSLSGFNLAPKDRLSVRAGGWYKLNMHICRSRCSLKHERSPLSKGAWLCLERQSIGKFIVYSQGGYAWLCLERQIRKFIVYSKGDSTCHDICYVSVCSL